MKTYGTKKILPVYGNSRPVERRINNIRIAGWKEQNISATPIISQEDTYNDSAYLRIYGKSEQIQTTQGKNLFDIDKFLSLSGNSTYYAKDVDGNLVQQASDYRLNGEYPISTTLPAGTYTLTIDATNFRFWVNNTKTITTKTFTLSEESTVAIKTWMPAGTNMGKVQLEAGSTATSYEPFVPNSPSPEYPSTINSVTNFDLVSKTKNILPLKTGTLNYGGLSVTIDETGLFTVTKAAASPTYIWVNLITLLGVNWGNPAIIGVGNLGFSETKSIRITLIPVSGIGLNLMKVNFRGYYGGTNTAAWETYAASLSLVRNIPANASICWQESSSLQTYSFRVIFEINDGIIPTKHTSYSSNSINFPYTLRSLPDGTKDYIEIDNVNKTAKLYRNVREYIFNGNEDWAFYSGIFGRLYTSSITDALYTSAISCYSNRYLGKVSGGGNTYTDPNNMWFQNTSLYPRLYINDFVNGGNTYNFKIWLGSQYNLGTPVTVQYKLATPIVENLDYNELLTYYPYTQIYTNATIQPTLDGTVRVIDR